MNLQPNKNQIMILKVHNIIKQSQTTLASIIALHVKVLETCKQNLGDNYLKMQESLVKQITSLNEIFNSQIVKNPENQQQSSDNQENKKSNSKNIQQAIQFLTKKDYKILIQDINVQVIKQIQLCFIELQIVSKASDIVEVEIVNNIVLHADQSSGQQQFTDSQQSQQQQLQQYIITKQLIYYNLGLWIKENIEKQSHEIKRIASIYNCSTYFHVGQKRWIIDLINRIINRYHQIEELQETIYFEKLQNPDVRKQEDIEIQMLNLGKQIALYIEKNGQNLKSIGSQYYWASYVHVGPRSQMFSFFYKIMHLLQVYKNEIKKQVYTNKCQD